MVEKLIDNVTFGSDCEWFLFDTTRQEVISAEGLIPGTKTEPYRFMEGQPWFAVQLDNVLAEGNIPPVETSEDFVKNLEILRKYIESTIPQTLRTLAIPAARLDQRFLQTENAKTFGCDPSLNCWTNEIVAPKPTGDNLRSAGFHIHVGYTRPTRKLNQRLAQAMDLMLGIPSVVIEPENERKKVGYGAAGNYRNQRHGCEYRVLSSFFASSEKLISWVVNNTKRAIDLVNQEIDLIEEAQEITNIINTPNRLRAFEKIRQYGIPMPTAA